MRVHCYLDTANTHYTVPYTEGYTFMAYYYYYYYYFSAWWTLLSFRRWNEFPQPFEKCCLRVRWPGSCVRGTAAILYALRINNLVGNFECSNRNSCKSIINAILIGARSFLFSLDSNLLLENYTFIHFWRFYFLFFFSALLRGGVLCAKNARFEAYYL